MKSHTRRKPHTPRNIIGPQVRKYRVGKGWTQTIFAARCQAYQAVTGTEWNISRDIVALIEGRSRWVGDFELVLLARVLEVPVVDLLPERVNWKELPITTD